MSAAVPWILAWCKSAYIPRAFGIACVFMHLLDMLRKDLAMTQRHQNTSYSLYDSLWKHEGNENDVKRNDTS